MIDQTEISILLGMLYALAKKYERAFTHEESESLKKIEKAINRIYYSDKAK